MPLLMKQCLRCIRDAVKAMRLEICIFVDKVTFLVWIEQWIVAKDFLAAPQLTNGLFAGRTAILAAFVNWRSSSIVFLHRRNYIFLFVLLRRYSIILHHSKYYFFFLCSVFRRKSVFAINFFERNSWIVIGFEAGGVHHLFAVNRLWIWPLKFKIRFQISFFHRAIDSYSSSWIAVKFWTATSFLLKGMWFLSVFISEGGFSWLFLAPDDFWTLPLWSAALIWFLISSMWGFVSCFTARRHLGSIFAEDGTWILFASYTCENCQPPFLVVAEYLKFSFFFIRAEPSIISGNSTSCFVLLDMAWIGCLAEKQRLQCTADSFYRFCLLWVGLLHCECAQYDSSKLALQS